MLLVLMSCSLLDAAEPSPFSGPRSIDATLACPTAAADADRPELVARLERLGIRGTVETVDADHLRVRLTRVADGTLERLLLPGRLQFSEVLDWPPEVALRADVERVDDFLGAARADAFAGLTLPPSTRVGTYCDAGGCRGYLLAEPAVTGSSVAEAVAGKVEWGTAVTIRFTPESAARFEAFTRRVVKRKMAIEVDGRVVSTPVVAEAIPSGKAVVTYGGGNLAEAQALAAALQGRPLTCAWTEVR